MGVLNFFGDVYLERPARAFVPLDGDYVLNLEGPLTCSQRPAWGKINLKADGAYFKETFGRNPVAVCLANNHIMDYGAEGLRDTLEALRVEGIQSFGAGGLAERCRNPLLLAVGGRRVALLGYVCPTSHPILAGADVPGAARLDLEQVETDLRAAREGGADRVVVQVHWGEEDVGLPRPADVAKARRIIDLGADLLIGHHSHCILPFEVYHGRHVFYGLGNTIFPDTKMVAYTRDGRRADNRQMRWGKRNRTSLTVRYDADTGQVAMRRLLFRDELAVVAGDHPERDLVFRGGTDARYQKKYARVRRLSFLKRLVMSFLARPRLPKKSNWRWLLERFKAEKKP
jgi:hypothetical protein